MWDKGQRFLHRKTADAGNPVYENANVSRETLIVGIAGKGEWRFQTAIFGFPFVIS